MTLPERIALIDALIKENREATVRDYTETLKEIEWVEQSQESKDKVSLLKDQGLLFRDHSKMIRTPAEKYNMVNVNHLKRVSA